MTLPDDPIIDCIQRTGYPPRHDDCAPVCPICREECDTIYTDVTGNVIGCENCVSRNDAWDVPACFPGDE